MQVVKPQTLGIVSSTVPEDEAPQWDAETAYSPANPSEGRLADEVIYNHYHYRALRETTNEPPATSFNTTDAAWFRVGVTNQYACIDLYRSTQTIAPEGETTLVVQVPFATPATIVSLQNMYANTVTARVTKTEDADSEEIWSSGEVVLLRDVKNWWEFFFTPMERKEDALFSGIPPATGVLTVTLEGPRPAVGSIIVGRPVSLGTTKYGVEVDNVDFSRVEEDDFGNVSFTKRHNARRGEFPIWFPPSRLDFVRRTIASVASTPALWIGDNGAGFESLTMIGYTRTNPTTVEGPNYCSMNIDIRGVV